MATQSLNLPVFRCQAQSNKLENDLSTVLLQRSTRRMYLIAEGKSLLQQARQLLDCVQMAEEKLLARKTDASGLLYINTAAPLMRHVLIPTLAELLHRIHVLN